MLSQNQKEISDQILTFLTSDKREIILSGTAGTGKSYVIKHLFNVIKKEYTDLCKILSVEPTIKQFKLTALSWKAISVLRNNLNECVNTLHSYLNIKIKTNYTTGKESLIFPPFLNHQNFNNTLLIIDEYSMIDYKVKEFLALLLNKYPTLKILYVGDRHQLLSPSGSCYDKFKHLNVLELVENFRIKEPRQLRIVNELKKNVETNTVATLDYFKNNFKVIGKTELVNYINQNFLHLDHNNVFLSYTNKSVIGFNNYVRKLKKLPNEFIQGEKLLNNSLCKVIQRNKKNIFLPLNYELIVHSMDLSPILFCNDIPDLFYYNLQSTCGLNIKIPQNYNYFQQILKQETKNKNWERYYDLKENLADLRTTDALTIHKSQGSTYDSVIINYNDIISCKQNQTKARMFYVAVSRAKNGVIIYDKTIN